MSQPDDFRVEDIPEMHALMRARPFAALVSAGSAGLYASHLPTVLKDDGPYGVVYQIAHKDAWHPLLIYGPTK
jgi:transcriptional regulator